MPSAVSFQVGHGRSYAQTQTLVFGPAILWVTSEAESTPPAPTNPTATATGASTVTVGWDDVADETGFRVERSLNGTTGWSDVSGNLAADTTSYADTGLTAETEYFYRVVAFNAVGDSSPSTTVSATTDAASAGGNRLGGTGAIRKPPRPNPATR